ncbi:hypothetical protein [Marinobacterium arenosum]|uniref:hypothetical protein n=1 Tax=Marinobacterium arenosum TaxID=2862496 RepID=UPI001C95024A|nr:hypothetical protein [Marinobacterium arenosum]MBY4678278.1 hypothetical protein [Marinobacterium arenosum]
MRTFSPIFRLTTLLASLVLLAGLLVVSVVKAVDDTNMFEIGADESAAGAPANILQETALPDWNALFDADGNPKDVLAPIGTPDYITFGFTEVAFIQDYLGVGNLVELTAFAGSNKNNDLPETWNWDSAGGIPPKSDLANIYFAAKINPADGHLIIYIGTERLANNGVVHIDNEFNAIAHGVDKVEPCDDDMVLPGPAGVTDATMDDPPCEFSGSRSIGDFHVTMDFLNGGGIGAVEIREWDGSEYVKIEDSNSVGCNAADTICAFNNDEPIASGDWDSFDRHGNMVDSIDTNLFTEMVVDVTAVLGRTPCIGSVISKTRSSPGSEDTFNAELKDFGLAAFPLCSIEIVKDGDTLSKVTDTANYDYTISNTGVAPVHLQSVIDLFDKDGDGMFDDETEMDLTAAASAAGCDTLQPQGMAGDSCMFSAPYVVQAGDADPLNNLVTATYNDLPNGSGVSLTDSDDHSLNLFQPSFTLVKECPVGIGDGINERAWKVGEPLDFRFTLTNTSSADTPLMDLVSLTDPLLSDMANDSILHLLPQATQDALAMLAKDESISFTLSYTPEFGDLGNGVTNSADAVYSPQGFPNQIGPTAPATVTCPVALPGPATIIIEKELRGSGGLTFDYTGGGLLVPSLTPVIGGDTTGSPHGPVQTPATDGFAKTEPISVATTFGMPTVYTVDETGLPPDTLFLSVSCRNPDGSLDADTTIAGTLATIRVDEDEIVVCRYVNEIIPGDEGCTPGFWKNSTGSWQVYSPNQTVVSVFNIPNNYKNGKDAISDSDTLLDALGYDGGETIRGAAKILLRAAVASILNAAHSGVDYPRTATAVINAVNAALATGDRDTILMLAGELDSDNNLGCPLPNDNSF